MKTLQNTVSSLIAIIALTTFLTESVQANSATWSTNPNNGDWNNPNNWSPGGPPNGPGDAATFGVSNITNVSISVNTEVKDSIFKPGASAYTITSPFGLALTFSGTGITNNSGVIQNFMTVAGQSDLSAFIRFDNGATAGNATITNSGSLRDEAHHWLGRGFTEFHDTSSASDSAIINLGAALPPGGGFYGGTTVFYNSSTAANATFSNRHSFAEGDGGSVIFHDSSNAGDASFVNQGGAFDFEGVGVITFRENSSASNASILNSGATWAGFTSGGQTHFYENTTASNATITNAGSVAGGQTSYTDFSSSSTATAATLIASGSPVGGQIWFSLNSTGGTARIQLFDQGRLDISNHTGGVTIGSMEGNGKALLGANTLTVGSNNLTTTFSGVIQNGGSLAKIGPGTLTLSGANTYTGPTAVTAGKLAVNGSIVSAVAVNGGTGSGTGLINGPVTVASGAALLGGDAVTPTGSLTIANNLTLNTGSIIELVLGAPGAHSSLTRTGGTWSFAPNQRFTFLDVGAQPGFYDNIITGLTSDPGGEATWTITNVGFTGTFSYDGAGNIDLTLTSAMGPALQMIEAVSRKTHGAAGDFDIPLPLTGQPGVECRSSNGNHTLVFTFDNDVVSGNASVMNGTASITSSPVFSNNTMTVQLTGVADVQTITVMLSGVTDSFGQVLPDKAISMTMLVGDTNGNKTVNASDIGQTKGQVGVPVSSSNYRTDVNANGAITSSDVSLVKANAGHGLAIASTAGR